MKQSRPVLKQAFKFASLAPTLSFLCIWANLNTGPWHFNSPSGLVGWMNAFRAALPYAVLPLSFFVTCSGKPSYLISSWAPSQMLAVYGIIAIVSCVFSNNLRMAIYLGVAYLATVYSAKAMTRQKDLSITNRYWMQMTWIVTTIMACILIYIGRNQLSLSSKSAYDIIDAAKGDVAGMAMSRSSGVARFAAIPGLIALCRVVTDRGWRKIVWLMPVVFFMYIVYKCQSRGAIFSTLVSIPMVFLAGWGRFKTMALGACLVIALTILDPEMTMLQKFEKHLQRGQSAEELESMTGRTRPWKNALIAFADSPILLGRGNWADRAVLGEHAHNAFVQALMIGGLLGIFFYTGSWISGWYLFFKIIRRIKELPLPDRSLFLEASAVMTFFFIRSIPETTTASYAVDLVIMVPVFCYLEFLDARITSGIDETGESSRCRLILRPIIQ